MRIISKENCIVSNWSGGKTFQYFIFPETADFSKKDFNFRISCANVDQEFSTFTKFNGYSRFLMILDGEMEITHENNQSKILKKYDFDIFSGSWHTFSKGKAQDFNIIFQEGLNLDFEVEDVGQNKQIYDKECFIFSLDDNLKLNNTKIELHSLVQLNENVELSSNNGSTKVLKIKLSLT